MNKPNHFSKFLFFQKNDYFEGSLEKCLELNKTPILLRSLKNFQHNLISFTNISSQSSLDFHFKRVNFIFTNIDKAFILQKRNPVMKIKYEECSFYLNKYR